MVSPRWLARLIIPVMAGAALVTGTATANADPADDAYLAQLRAAGFTWPPDHEAASPAWGVSSATISGGVGHMTRSPSRSTPPWTRETFRWETSDPWCASRIRPIAPTSGAGRLTANPVQRRVVAQIHGFRRNYSTLGDQ